MLYDEISTIEELRRQIIGVTVYAAVVSAALAGTFIWFL